MPTKTRNVGNPNHGHPVTSALHPPNLTASRAQPGRTSTVDRLYPSPHRQRRASVSRHCACCDGDTVPNTPPRVKRRSSHTRIRSASPVWEKTQVGPHGTTPMHHDFAPQHLVHEREVQRGEILILTRIVAGLLTSWRALESAAEASTTATHHPALRDVGCGDSLGSAARGRGPALSEPIHGDVQPCSSPTNSRSSSASSAWSYHLGKREQRLSGSGEPRRPARSPSLPPRHRDASPVLDGNIFFAIPRPLVNRPKGRCVPATASVDKAAAAHRQRTSPRHRRAPRTVSPRESARATEDMEESSPLPRRSPRRYTKDTASCARRRGCSHDIVRLPRSPAPHRPRKTAKTTNRDPSLDWVRDVNWNTVEPSVPAHPYSVRAATGAASVYASSTPTLQRAEQKKEFGAPQRYVLPPRTLEDIVRAAEAAARGMHARATSVKAGHRRSVASGALHGPQHRTHIYRTSQPTERTLSPPTPGSDTSDRSNRRQCGPLPQPTSAASPTSDPSVSCSTAYNDPPGQAGGGADDSSLKSSVPAGAWLDQASWRAVTSLLDNEARERLAVVEEQYEHRAMLGKLHRDTAPSAVPTIAREPPPESIDVSAPTQQDSNVNRRLLLGLPSPEPNAGDLVTDYRGRSKHSSRSTSSGSAHGSFLSAVTVDTFEDASPNLTEASFAPPSPPQGVGRASRFLLSPVPSSSPSLVHAGLHASCRETQRRLPLRRTAAVMVVTPPSVARHTSELLSPSPKPPPPPPGAACRLHRALLSPSSGEEPVEHTNAAVAVMETGEEIPPTAKTDASVPCTHAAVQRNEVSASSCSESSCRSETATLSQEPQGMWTGPTLSQCASSTSADVAQHPPQGSGDSASSAIGRLPSRSASPPDTASPPGQPAADPVEGQGGRTPTNDDVEEVDTVSTDA